MQGFGLVKREIWVFGSNREGRHGRGSALVAARAFGAKYGQAEGLQGDSYGIVTKELRSDYPPVTMEEIARGVREFLQFAALRPDLIFNVAAIGCGLAGFLPEAIAHMFKDYPDNVRLPKEFISELLKAPEPDVIHYS